MKKVKKIIKDFCFFYLVKYFMASKRVLLINLIDFVFSCNKNKSNQIIRAKMKSKMGF